MSRCFLLLCICMSLLVFVWWNCLNCNPSLLSKVIYKKYIEIHHWIGKPFLKTTFIVFVFNGIGLDWIELNHEPHLSEFHSVHGWFLLNRVLLAGFSFSFYFSDSSFFLFLFLFLFLFPFSFISRISQAPQKIHSSISKTNLHPIYSSPFLIYFPSFISSLLFLLNFYYHFS